MPDIARPQGLARSGFRARSTGHDSATGRMRIRHLLDDCALGGVMSALENFKAPAVTRMAVNIVDEVETRKRRARRYDDDILIIHFTMAWAKLWYLATLRVMNRHRQIFLIEHSYTQGYERDQVSQRWRFRLMLMISYGLCDRVIAVSEGQATWAGRLVRPGKLVVIPQSRPLHSFRQIPPVTPLAGRPLRFGAIGRFHRQKGFDLLIEAFRAADPKNATLDLVGYGDDEDDLRRAAAGDQRIRFPGVTHDPGAFYASVDVVIIPSRWEAFGLVASEAMAAGRPVIVADIDGLPEQLITPGMTFAAHNVPDLARQITRMCTAFDPSALTGADRDATCMRHQNLIEGWCALFEETAARTGRKIRAA